MTLEEFHQSLTASEPPAELTLALLGLWWDGKGDWTRAHESAQQDEDMEGSWVHAYLHRKEGDQGSGAQEEHGQFRQLIGSLQAGSGHFGSGPMKQETGGLFGGWLAVVRRITTWNEQSCGHGETR